MNREALGHIPDKPSRIRRRNRSNIQLLLETMEPRIVLAGTPALIDINPAGDASPAGFTQVGNQSFFVADDGTSGRELWVTDGTEAGTRLVLDINPGSGDSSPRDFFAFQGELYFAADDGSHGEELWKSDGTASGTVMLRDIHPGSGYQYPYGYGPLGSFPRDFTEFNGLLYFSAEDATNGGELWRTDGTEAGTMRVIDLWPGEGDRYGSPYPYSSNPQDLTVFNGHIYFSADDGAHGRELWRTDGTEAGTSLVKDIFPGAYSYPGYGPYPYSSIPTQFTEVNGELFFVAFDQNAGVELFKTDGTGDGTVVVKDINPGIQNSMNGADSLVNVNGTLFFIADDGTSGIELWKSDGTEAGTVQIRDVNPGSASGLENAQLVVLNNLALFAANDGTNGTELWRSNGTTGGTFLISNIAVGEYTPGPQDLAVIDGRLFFSATSADEGRELWESNGLAVAPVADLNSGTDDANPTAFGELNGLLLFSATDGFNGHELWTVDALQAATAQLTIYVDSQRVAIPANIGIDDQGEFTSVVRTLDADGTIFVEPIPGIQIDDIELSVFFDTWQLAAGVATNNPDASFSATELMGNQATATNTVQMFVNGQLNTQYERYVVQDGDEIVLVYGSNPVVSLNTNFGPIVIELFEQDTPGTVDNFLNYVNDGDYINSFFHRSDPDFVIQGGGFRTPSTTFSDTSQFSSVPTDGPIQNEPGISNLRGTVAMAKLGGDPNSATSQFFVNLSDSNSVLDSAANNAFTVFGQVLDMTTVDTIEDLPLVDTGISPYRELPVSANNELAVIGSISGFGEITGTYFVDTDGDGTMDAGEFGLSDVRVYVDSNTNGMFDVGESFAFTDGQGNYRLQAGPGSHSIRTIAPGAIITTSPASGTRSVTVQTGREVSGIDFGSGPIPFVGMIDLLAVSDLGISDSDNLTSLDNSSHESTLRFEVMDVLSGAEVRLFSDGVLIGSATANGTSVIITTTGTTALAEGVRAITATQIVDGTESAASAAFNITIDTTPAAAITNMPAATAQVGQPFSFDPSSPDEGTAGTTYKLINAPAGMTIDSQTGQINWTPAGSQAVPTSFEIAVVDAAGNETPLAINLTVLGAIPALPDTYFVNEDNTLTVTGTNGVLANDGNQTSGTLTAVVITQPTNGTLTLNADGSFTYVPAPNFFGTDSFTYQATDGTDDSNAAQVTLTVNPVNDAPVGVADAYTVSEDSTSVIQAPTGVLANDTDVDGDTLTATVANQPANGTLSLNADGSFTYTPAANFSGTDSFTYTVSDGTVTSSPIAVTITVEGQNDPPTVVGDSYTVAEDGSLSINAANGVLANDSDPEGTQMTATVNTSPANGTLTLNPNGSFTYSPNANFNGTDSFSYTATDSGGATATGSVTITVTSQPDLPTATNDAITVNNDGTSHVIDVLNNDSSAPDGNQTLTVTSVTQGVQGGAVTLTDGVVRYTPATGFSGTDSFTYTIRDTDGLTDTATVTVTVTRQATGTITGLVYLDADDDGVRDAGEVGIPGVMITLTGTASSGASINRTYITTNDGAFAFDDLPAGTYQLTENQPHALADGKDTTSVSGAVTANNQFTNLVLAGGQTLSGNNFGETAIRPGYVSIAWFFASASNPNMVFRRAVAAAEADAGNQELADRIMMENPNGTSSSPIAFVDAYATESNTTLTVNAANGVLANDTDPDGDILTATRVSGPANGTLTLNANGSFTYIPATNFSGTDTFTYTASDGTNSSNTSTVTITVTGQPASANTFTIPENSPAGTVVGTVVSQTVTGNTPFYQFVDSSVREELRLRPDDHISGNPESPLVLIEYLDLECPVCRQFHPIVEDLEDTFEDDLLVVRRHFPLTSVHPNAMTAARYAEAAGRQDMFLEMADLMFANQDDWNAPADPVPFFETYAQQLGLDMTQLTADLADSSLNARIQRDIDATTALGASATPTFYLNGRFLDNSDALDDFEELIDDELDDYDEPFLINRLTGQITVSGFSGLNFESQPTITRQVLVRNLNGATETVTVTVNLTDVNEAAPVGVADSYSVATNGTLTVNAATGVLSNDTDADGDDLVAVLSSSTSNGTLTLNGDGSFTYVPSAEFRGTDSFRYRASDGELNSAITTVTITVTGEQRSPVAVNDAFNVNENTTLSVSAAQGVLANDSDPDGDPLTATLVTATSNGTVTLSANGSFVYSPNSGFSGTDSFTYRASDNGGRTSQLATVAITVNDVNLAPVAVADTYSLNENSTLTVDASAGVLTNDTDPDGDTLTATLVSSVANGSLSFNGNGSFTYAPNTDFVGTDSFTYRISDGQLTSGTVTVTISILDTNTAPVGVADTYTVAEDAVLTVNALQGVLANDSDADGDALIAVLVQSPTSGTVTLDDDGSFVYIPIANFFGTDTFTYLIDDGTVDSDAVTVTISVTSVNDAPVANDNSYTLPEDTTLTTSAANGVLANDIDADGDTLIAALVSDVTHGTLTLASDGSFIYVPDANFSGTDSFTYMAGDGTVESLIATVTITVNPTNDIPVGMPDAYSTGVNTTLTVPVASGVLANDEDVDGDSLAAVLVTSVANGNLSLDANGSFTYTPDTDFRGMDSFTYQINDGTTNSEPVTVTIQVNTAPMAIDDAYVVDEDATLTVDSTFGVLVNDTDVDGDTLSATLVAAPSHGSVTLNADGSLEYVPTADFFGIDSFSYMASDGFVDSNVATVTITVFSVPDAPFAGDDMYVVAVDASLSVDSAIGLLVNDGDVDGDSLTPQLVDDVSNGTLTLNTDGSFAYTPNAGFHGNDAFTYRVNDGTLDSNLAAVVIQVNSPAVAVADSYSLNEDSVLSVSTAQGVLANDSDIDADTLTVSLVSDVTSGALTLNADGSFVYTPDANFNGADSFTYVINDGFVDSPATTVSLTVVSVNDRPVGNADIFNIDEDTVLMLDAASGPLANDTDVDGDMLFMLVVNNPTHGTLDWDDDGSLTYTPNANFFGTDSFTYTADDGNLVTTAIITVTIHVAPINDLPVSVDDAYELLEDGSLVVPAAEGVLANDTDIESPTLAATLVTDVQHGSLSLAIDGSFTYTPDPNFSGTDSFTYVANDGSEDSPPATVTLTVVSVNDVPVGVDDSHTVAEDGVLSIGVNEGVLANDTDADGDTLSAVLIDDVSHGTLQLNSDGSFQYTPDADFAGADHFTYRATDGTDSSPLVTVSIDVTSVNDAPIALSDSYVADEDTALNISVVDGLLVNDSDVESAMITAILLTQPTNGSVTLNSDGSFVYTPNPDFHGTDSFTYQATDGELVSAVATVTINVTALNDAPVAAADSYQTNFDTELDVTAANGVLVNDTDPEVSTLTAIISSLPSNGSVMLQSSGAFSYTPNTGFSGTDSFTYRANDGAANSAETTVTITVNNANSLFVPASLAADTVVGRVTPDASLGSTVVFEIENSSQPADLALVADDRLSGDPTAAVVLIDYFDLACPVCQTFHPIVNALKVQYPDDLLVVSRHFPLNSGTAGDTFHPNGWEAAQAAEAAGNQGKFDEMLDLLFEHQSTWSTTTADAQAIFEGYANQLGLNMTQFVADYSNPATRTRVQRDRDTALANGWNSTPTYFINGVQQNNSAALADFAGLIQDALDLFDSPFLLNRQTGELLVADSAALAAAAGSTLTLHVNVTDLAGNTIPETVTIQIGPQNAPQAAMSSGVYVAPAATRVPQILTSNRVVRSLGTAAPPRPIQDLVAASIARRNTSTARYAHPAAQEDRFDATADRVFASLDDWLV